MAQAQPELDSKIEIGKVNQAEQDLNACISQTDLELDRLNYRCKGALNMFYECVFRRENPENKCKGEMRDIAECLEGVEMGVELKEVVGGNIYKAVYEEEH